MRRIVFQVLAAAGFLVVTGSAFADDKPAGGGEAASTRPKRLLLIGQGPDNHAWSTHEYHAGNRLLAECLQPVAGLQTILVSADEPWANGPELLDGADAVVLFVSEGAKFVSANPERVAAFNKLAARGGGLTVLHWGMGTRAAEPVDAFVRLFGGCHGGPDRKYKVLETDVRPVAAGHPITRGVEPFRLHDEFYYRLKFPKDAEGLTPLVQVTIDDEPQTVAWAWERPDGGRSFGYSALHFHKNWERIENRRLVTQGILWTQKVDPPAGLPLAYKEDLSNPREKRAKEK